MSKKSKVETPVIEKVEETEVEQDNDINAGLKVSVRDVMAQREQKWQQAQQERALRESSPTGSRLTRLKVMADTPYGVKFLHDFDKSVELYVHLWKGDTPCHEICKVHYGEKCDICQMVSTKFGECYAIAVRCFIGWVYNLVGQSFEKVVNGETKRFNLNPIKLVEIPLGKEDANTTILQEAARRKYFRDDIWQIERKAGKGMLVPKTIAAEDFQKKVGREVDLGVNEAAEKIGEMSKTEILKMILGSFENVQWEVLGFKPPQAKPLEENSAPKKDEISSRDVL